MRDLIVIGAGINGAAIARAAARAGYSVLVLEQEDLGSGTTSASTRLIHGGLRYLEHGEIGLVRESLREREALLETAPHLVEPLRLYLPIYRGARRPRWQIRLGLALYDLLSRGKSLPSHEMLDRAELHDRVPALRDVGLVGGACYFDAQITFPERLVVENLLDAADHGAEIRNHARVTEIAVERGAVAGVSWRRADGTEGRERARAVVNAAGPWVDRVAGCIAGAARPRRLVGGTKGSHLVVEPFPGAPSAAIYTEAASDGRPFFIVPWNGLYLIGTTDVRCDDDPSGAAISTAELEYLVAETERLFPAAGPVTTRVCYTQAGIRALPYSPGAVEGAITRRHIVHRHDEAKGLYSIIGGKLTTHRSLAADALRRLRRDGALSGAPHGDGGGRSSAEVLVGAPLPGAVGDERAALLADLGARFGDAPAARLVRTYGRLAVRIADAARARCELAEPVTPGIDLLRAEVVRAIETEWAETLVDILHRRTMVGLGPDFGAAAAPAAARALVELGVWDDARAAGELEAYQLYASAHGAADGQRASSAGSSIGSKRSVGRSPRRE